MTRKAGSPDKVGIDETLHATLADGAERSERYRQKVGRERNGLAVKISARDHVAAVDEDHRIIGSAIDLGLHDAGDIAERVAHRSVDLRHAAKRITVLHAVAISVGLSQLASEKQLPQPAGGLDLSAMRARLMNPRVESDVRS